MSEFPSDWKVLSLSEVAERVRRTSDDQNLDVLTISSTEGWVDQKKKWARDMAGKSIEKYTLLQQGEFSYNKGNSKTYPQGCIFRLENWHKALVPNSFSVTNPEADGKFLQHLFASGGLNDQLRSVITSSVRDNGLLNITADTFFSSEVPLPPLPEQKKIAEILSRIDKQLDLRNLQESKTHELLRAILQSAFSEPDLSPYSDTSYSLAELEVQGKISLGRGDIISKIDIRERPGGHPIYSSSGKGDGKFGEYGEYMFDEELITWSIDGGGRLFHRSKHKFSVTNVCGYLRKMDDSIDYGYLHSALEYQHAKIKFDYSHKAHPSVIREIYRVALPPLERQLQIASTTASAKQQIEALSNKRNTLTTLKSAVSSDLLSGRKRVSI